MVAAVGEEAARLRKGEAEGLDEELAAAFDRVRPASPGEADLGALRDAAFVDVTPPVEGGGPGATAKRAVRKAIAFNLRHLASQLRVVHEAMVDALASLDARVSALEGAMEPDVDVRAADATVAEVSASVAGSAVVVRGWVRGPGEAVAVADRLGHEVAADGVAVVVGVVPDQWSTVVSPVVADLGGVRPLHAETWVHLLGERGFSDPQVHAVGALYVVAARR